MAFLLDTHTFLWFISGDKQLPVSLRKRIEDINQPCFLSVASLWEITIKYQIGSLELNITLKELFDSVDKNNFELVSITYDHLLTLSKLPKHHSDPFDRLIVSQAIAEDFDLITKDKGLKKYKVKQKWT